MTALPLPGFYDPTRVRELFVERAALVADVAEAYAAKQRIAPAADDRFRIAAFGIDVQVGFCVPGASLYVPGAVEDTQRAVDWLYRNLDRVSELCFSLDTHRVFQIFHPAWWLDAEGKHPAPLTPITHEALVCGR